jgi:hypothetical protein
VNDQVHILVKLRAILIVVFQSLKDKRGYIHAWCQTIKSEELLNFICELLSRVNLLNFLLWLRLYLHFELSDLFLESRHTIVSLIDWSFTHLAETAMACESCLVWNSLRTGLALHHQGVNDA